MRRWLRLDPETRELRLVLADLFDGRHTRTEYRCIDGDGRPLRGPRWADLDGRRIEYSAACDGRFYFEASPFGPQRVWLDLEPRPVVDERLDCRLFDRRGEQAVRNRNRACPRCRETDASAGTAFDKTAEFIGEYLTIGRLVYLDGRLQTRAYDLDGVRRWATTIVVNRL